MPKKWPCWSWLIVAVLACGCGSASTGAEDAGVSDARADSDSVDSCHCLPPHDGQALGSK